MTTQEALELLNNMEFAEKYQGKQKYTDMLFLCKEALEKQIEKKPIIKQRVGLEYYTCPNPECEDYLGNRFPKRLVKTSYCECCGQALDWSDEE